MKNRYLCKVQIGDEYFPMLSKGESIEEARSHLINTYHLDRKQIIDITNRENIETYQPSYMGGSSVHILHKPNRRTYGSLSN